jgi:hypothetical protein
VKYGVVMLLFFLAAAAPTTRNGPDVVLLKELSSAYEPVPFDHKTHAAMAEMWDGCTTCHHRKPSPSTHPIDLAKTQDNADATPACRTCHEVTSIEKADLHRPNLKGAYHRQCLNCHREWAHENACGACHKERDISRPVSTAKAPSVDDIVGRMHPPIPEPREKIYVARFTPAVGSNVLFRHDEHVKSFGLKCVSCHRKDTCATCHAPGASAALIPASQRPVHPGRTWQDSHGPCAACHTNESCKHCHYGADQKPPAKFQHASTGQQLDKDHASLKCLQCHTTLRSNRELRCGGSECHPKGPITFPAHRPGPTVTTKSAVIQVAVAQATTQPSTRAAIKRIRR